MAMNIDPAKEAARIYFGYDHVSDARWEDVWKHMSTDAKTLASRVANAVLACQEPQDAAEQNTGPVVDADARAIIVALQAQIAELQSRVSAAEAWTRPLGSAKVLGEELFEGGKVALDLGSTIVKATKKGFW